MEPALKKEIEEIAGTLNLKCPEDFKCCQCGIETLCKSRKMDDGVDSYLECLEQDSGQCIFAIYLSGGGFYLCSCPLRKYIADKKEAKK